MTVACDFPTGNEQTHAGWLLVCKQLEGRLGNYMMEDPPPHIHSLDRHVCDSLDCAERMDGMLML